MVLPADLTRIQARACLQMLVQGLRLEQEPMVVVDAAALSHFDSTALAVLLEFRRASLAMGKSLTVRAMPQRLRDLATLYGIGELLPDV